MASGIRAGSLARRVRITGSPHDDVRSYGFAQGSGYAFAIFNNTLHAIDVEARVKGSSRTSFTAALATYGKVQYDKSKGNKWVGPLRRRLGQVGTSVPLDLPPYSVSILSLT